jgi:acyl transferase domain-containing protein
MGFTGPAINIQTACSTSLVAVAQACQALASRQCDLAITGGVSVTLPQTSTYSYHEGGIYSRDGHCRAFDAKATGTVFGDGAGAVVLKRLEDASRDGDRIDAVIRGWAVNNDGSNKASFAAPSVNGQAQVIMRAQDHAGVQPKDISYVEAHGTGTPVGDPIEFAALARAFRRGTNGRGVCGLGTVKTNIGHLDAAAGIAGLIKIVLALQHREIPPTLHFSQANPEIDLDSSPFYIVDQLSAWTTNGHDQPLVGGVSSFGIGGTNCHVVLQEAPIPEAAAIETGLPAYLLTVSAASEGALDELEGCYRQFLEQNPMPDIARIAATTRPRRPRRPRSTTPGDPRWCGNGSTARRAGRRCHPHCAGRTRTPVAWAG